LLNWIIASRRNNELHGFGIGASSCWWLVAGGWWLVAGGWWLVAGGWNFVQT
jgi:hypothetical protein